MGTSELRLYEEILLLALRDREGTVAWGAMDGFAMGGAILAELLLEERIHIDEPRRKRKLITLTRHAPTGDDLLDESLERIAGARRRKRPETWVSHFASMKRLRHRVAAQLCRRGILKADEDTFLLLFTRKAYPEINPEPERQLIDRLQHAIFTDADTIDPRTIVLVSLAKSTGILPVVFDKKRLRARKKRIDKLVNGEVAGKAAADAVAAMQAAIVAACTASTVAASTASH